MIRYWLISKVWSLVLFELVTSRGSIWCSWLSIRSSELGYVKNARRLFLLGLLMVVYPNCQRMNIFHAQWGQPSLERSVYLGINRQSLWTCLPVKELKSAQKLEHTWERFLVIARLLIWKLLSRFVLQVICHLHKTMLIHKILHIFFVAISCCLICISSWLSNGPLFYNLQPLTDLLPFHLSVALFSLCSDKFVSSVRIAIKSFFFKGISCIHFFFHNPGFL